jgi:hypothetical protein
VSVSVSLNIDQEVTLLKWDEGDTTAPEVLSQVEGQLTLELTASPLFLRSVTP